MKKEPKGLIYKTLYSLFLDLKFLLKGVLLIFLAALLFFITLTISLVFQQETLIFNPKLEIINPESSVLDLKISQHQLPNYPYKSYAWYLKNEDSSHCIFYFYDSKSSSGHSLEKIRWINQLIPSSFFIIEYPGFGQNQGVPKEEEIVKLLKAWSDYCKNQLDLKNQPQIIWGKEIGAAIGAHFSNMIPTQGLILESTFYNMIEMASEDFPLLPISLLCRNPYYTSENLTHAQFPIAIIHSPDDNTIPLSYSLKLAESLKEKNVTHYAISGNHSSGYLNHAKEFKHILSGFLSQSSQNPEFK